ncbi:type 11 methyltransferase [Petrotoga mexicana DSM 14811]|uniref:Type 11 methyltransferase n=1 Tax=Petrotoga mexicana DSM 14811 TaxID=1122954 RepID=A0A2K1P4U3_9BACT|nr:class I SAM-dependent methyltransferase [Petrotoga mexicana]PNR97792.1 type 11 methyltransferase [Petrotoga mexicana DSM 14811]
MSKYNKKRIARLFDNMADTKGKAVEQIAGSSESIPQIAGRLAFEQLKLTGEDVLLDVGTGTGDKAIAAAHICRQVIGIDISRKSLEQARIKAEKEKLNNVIFAYGAFEEPCAEFNLALYGITKILAVYSLHHLPDQLKKESLITLSNFLFRPGRMVIGDIMFFDEPNKHLEKFNEVYYDGGDTDFPSRVEYLTECLKQIGGKTRIEQIHPLVGVIISDFV